MKKSLLALAVIGAFAGAASAQTNVTLYGIADAGVGYADNDAPGGDGYMNVFSGVQSTSRFGIRGSEDLGSGLKATFNIEAGVNFDTGASDAVFWQRRAVVGLASGFGEIRIGRDYTPGFTAAGTTDIMGYGLMGNWLTFTAQNGVGTGAGGTFNQGNLGGISTRASNGLHYTSPSWGGLTLRAMYAAGEADDVVAPSNAGDMYGLSGVWQGGALTVSGFYQQFEYDDTLGDTESVAQYGAGAQFRLGIFRVAFNYGMADADLPGGGSADHEGYQLGAGMKLGAGEFLVSYIHQETDFLGTSPEADTWGLAYVHPLSKRTNIYATYGQTNNDNGGVFGLNYSQSSVAAGAADASPKAFAIGVRHLF